MALKIPTTLGIISFALASSACSDSRTLANAYEKICKAQCECEDEAEYWDDVKNCELACEGYATYQRAFLNERFDDEEPCDDLKKIAKDIKKCAKESCDDIDECIAEHAQDLNECIGMGGYSYDPYYYGLSTEEHRSRAIKGELDAQLLYGPRPLDCSANNDDRSVLCDAMGLTEE